MSSRFDFRLTPAYCLYNGAAVLEQNGVNIKFLVENKEDTVLRGRLERAFLNHVGSMQKIKDCPEEFRNLPRIEFVQGTRRQLRTCVSQLYKAEEKSVKEQAEREIEKSQREAAAVLLLDSILSEARLRGATDIHIESSCVRFRIHGQLEKELELQPEKSLELIQRIKLLAGMNVIEKRKCQDGHFIYGSKKPFFLRVSTMAVIGEKYDGEESVVMRLLDTSRIPLALESLGFNLLQLEKLEELICENNGLVLVCGPTGSGKSTTVSSLLVELEKKASGALKIISLEDPPEYVIPGVTQVKVDERNPFRDALNHIFRQDPDVIMIGEIRDEESAAAALRASLTGHLVFATLHAGSATESFSRLENLGLDTGLLFQVFRGAVCQELNYSGGKIRLYADIALPGEGFCLEKPDLQHFTNYSEILKETMENLKKRMGNEGREQREKLRLPYYEKNARSNNEGVYGRIV